MKRSFVIILILFISNGLWSQTSQDNLSLDDYLKLVINNHPVAKQAALMLAEADAYVLKSRGAFDPKIKGGLEQKSFDGKEYFTIGEAKLEVPTWYGIKLKGGFNWTDGIFLNPERSLPDAGQAELGIEVNLLQGLVIDQRRADLAQAQLLANLNDAQRISMLNDLLLKAANAYWDWSLAQRKVEIDQNALELAINRLAALRVQEEQGYKSAIDTLESSIQVQTRRTALFDAQNELQKSRLKLSNFLWTQDLTPIEVIPGTRSLTLNEQLVEQFTDTQWQAYNQQFASAQPDLLQYRYQIEQLEIEQRWRREQLKPKLTVSYNFLADGTSFNAFRADDRSAFNNLLTENYKAGVNLSFPLFLRKQRANLNLNQIKIQQTDWKRQQKTLELGNKMEMAYNQLENLTKQIDQYIITVRDYTSLRDAEVEKFDLGFSSFFLINSREQKLIEAQKKLAELRAKGLKTKVEVRAISGLLHTDF